ncbi:MAG: hypothetical protein M0D53_10790 [Flavobacterium sp. JAD_PAG50586_2]|nr:MAG: hypothetical protein M0D53_10790 [Flavobacterium sp. JAD_PAG50586_2]
MKNSTLKNSSKGNLPMLVCFILLVGFLPSSLQSQNYRSIEAYMEDFGKNEMFIKKALMDYTVTIVESHLESRSRATASKIIDKINNINSVLKRTDKGFEGNTLLRDSFIKINDLTIQSLNDGSLILNDYDYQSSLSLAEIGENLNRKEAAMMAYYKGLQDYEQAKKTFGANFKLHFKKPVGKNILEYNATQNILFYKINVMDEKLTKVVAAMDKKGFDDCMNMIALMHQDIMEKTAANRNYFKDNSLNQANVDYANLINNQGTQLSALFNDYTTSYENLQQLKKSTNAEAPDTAESVAVYNESVRDYNNKKNLFYAVFNDIQKTKDASYDQWLAVNANFLKNNGQFDNLHDRYAVND